VLVIHLLTLIPVELPGLSIIQAVSGFLILSFVPGFLLVSYALDEVTLPGFLYATGFSVAFSMFIGSAANLFISDSLPMWFSSPSRRCRCCMWVHLVH